MKDVGTWFASKKKRKSERFETAKDADLFLLRIERDCECKPEVHLSRRKVRGF